MMSNSLAAKCRSLVWEDRQRDADIAEEWLKIYCRHWATVGKDWQTYEKMPAKETALARGYVEIMRRADRLIDNGFRGNFIALHEPINGPTYYE